jgi:DNA-binding NarL/FixJ family response regulator
MFKLLIISDDIETRTDIKKCLGEFDVFIFEASDVVTGVGIYKRYNPTIVIIDIDISTGVFCGFEFFDLLIDEINPKVLVVTTSRDALILRRCVEKGASGCFYKPVDCDAFTQQFLSICEEKGEIIPKIKLNYLKRFEKTNLTPLLLEDPTITPKAHQFFSTKLKEARCVVCCNTEERALAVLKKMYDKISFLIIDWRSMDPKRLELLKRFNEFPCTRHMPSLILLEQENKEKLSYALKNGADSYIIAPFETEELRRKIYEILP